MLLEHRFGADGDAPENQPVGSSSASGAAEQYPVCFALVTAQAGAHTELLSALQTEIVLPLVERRLIREFRVVAATPASFVAEDTTLLVFELLVPCPAQITDREVEQWQWRLGASVRLVVVSSDASAGNDSCDRTRARSALERAMQRGPVRKPRRVSKVPWLAACMDRNHVREEPLANPDSAPFMFMKDEITGRRIRIPSSMGATLMNDTISTELAKHLPASLRWRLAWRLVYSPRIHGVSLTTFYRKVKDAGPTVLLVQDHEGYAFGGFASAEWHVAERYFGDGESFVFRFVRQLPKPVVSLSKQLELLSGQGGGDLEEPAAQVAIQRALESIRDWQRKMALQAEKAEREAAFSKNRMTSPTEALDALLGLEDGLSVSASSTPATAVKLPSHHRDPDFEASKGADGLDSQDRDVDSESTYSYDDLADGDPGLQVYTWSSKDPFFLYSDLECIAMGGGSAFAFYLDKDLLHGMSEPCSTFKSDRLSITDNFAISDLEVWAFDDPSESSHMHKRPPKRS